MPQPVTGAVLAGGKSRRMGIDKCAIPTPDGRAIIETVVAKFRRIFSEVIVISNDPAPLLHLRTPTFPDAVPGAGSLGGIYSAILASSNDRCFVAACDMPFLSEALINYMVERTLTYDVLIPRTSEGWEPLHAIYRQTCLEPIKRVLDRGGRKIMDFFPEVRVEVVDEKEIADCDPSGLSFMNVNTPEDLEKANAIWRNLAKQP